MCGGLPTVGVAVGLLGKYVPRVFKPKIIIIMNVSAKEIALKEDSTG